MKKAIITFLGILIFITFTCIIIYFFINTNSSNTTSNTNISTTTVTQQQNNIKLEDIPLDFTIDDAINSNYFVCTYTQNYNDDKLKSFISNIENKIPDNIRIAFSTPEGDVILKDIILQNDGNIIFREINHFFYSFN